MSAPTEKPPLILLTGFLGAGKTTTINRVLGRQHHRRVGVIVNELGRIDIDSRLIKSRAGAHAHGQLVAVSFTDEQPLLGEPLMAVIDGLGPALVRAKGFIRLAGSLHRGFLERAGAHTSLVLGDAWGADTPRTEMVLIGEALDADAINRQLWACRARR